MGRCFLRTLAATEISRSIPVRRSFTNAISVHALEVERYFLGTFFAELVELVHILFAHSEAMQFEWFAIL